MNGSKNEKNGQLMNSDWKDNWLHISGSESTIGHI